MTTLESAEFLTSTAGQKAAAALEGADLAPDKTMALLTALRRTATPEEAGSVLTLARLRLQARTKFPLAERMFFSAEALEQSTAWPVALHRAAWLHRFAPPGPLLDLGCGIGGDLLALAQQRPVIAYERDAARLHFARANAAAANLADRIDFRLTDWVDDLRRGALQGAAAFVDPARRVDGRRVFSLHAMAPPLSVVLELAAAIPALAVKTMPGIDDDEIPAGCSVEFISHEGVCKEAVLWFGPLMSTPRRASVHTPDGWLEIAAGGEAAPVGELHPGQILYEPDPALIRASALDTLCATLQAHLFDPTIAYLVSEELHQTRLAHPFRVNEIHPFGLKLLNRRLAALGVARVELKKRGFPTEPEELRPKLRLARHGGDAVVIFTQRNRAHLMLICERLGQL